jgi:tRNA (cmo5U34)-methyltransferase
VAIIECDLREGLRPWPDVSLITAILTMMFIPVECRQTLLHDIYMNLQPGGAFIMVEKLLGEGASIDRLLVKEYYSLKEAEGYSSEEIERKRLSLQGVLVPDTANHQIEVLHQVGFQSVDCFWRWMNFAGFIAIK